jgi:hypothetical protein
MNVPIPPPPRGDRFPGYTRVCLRSIDAAPDGATCRPIYAAEDRCRPFSPAAARTWSRRSNKWDSHAGWPDPGCGSDLRAGGRKRCNGCPLRPSPVQGRAFSVRYFLGFTTSGLAVPLIALLHGMSEFTLVLSVAASFGMVIFLCSAGFVTQGSSERSSLPAH